MDGNNLKRGDTLPEGFIAGRALPGLRVGKVGPSREALIVGTVLGCVVVGCVAVACIAATVAFIGWLF